MENDRNKEKQRREGKRFTKKNQIVTYTYKHQKKKGEGKRRKGMVSGRREGGKKK